MYSHRFFLGQAWNITKKYRYLWFFGLFAALLYASGEYQIINVIVKQKNSLTFSDGWLATITSIFSASFWQGLVELAVQNPIFFWSFLSLAILISILLLLVLYISISSQISLVDQIAKIINNKKKPADTNIVNNLKRSRPWFWPILWLNLGAKCAVSILFLILSLPLLSIIISSDFFSTIIFTISFLIFIPVALFISFVTKYAIASRIIEGGNLIKALKRGYLMFINNWLVSFEMAFVLFVINFLVGFLTLIIVSILFVPIFIVGQLITSVGLVFISLLLVIISMATAASLLGVFQTSAWTGLFLRLAEGKVRSKLERTFAKK